MTQQDKELLIKDLCARLPYGVRGRDNEFDYEYESSVVIGVTSEVDADDYLVHYEDTTPGYLYADGFKPILFPLSAINIKRFGLQSQNLIGYSPAASGVEDVEWSALVGTVKRQYIRV